jgi:hypothetical protein
LSNFNFEAIFITHCDWHTVYDTYQELQFPWPKVYRRNSVLKQYFQRGREVDTRTQLQNNLSLLDLDSDIWWFNTKLVVIFRKLKKNFWRLVFKCCKNAKINLLFHYNFFDNTFKPKDFVLNVKKIWGHHP